MTDRWTSERPGGVPITVHELGGDGPPLLICHATGFCGAMYGVLAQHLRRRFRVVALDARGHGDSEVPEDGDQSFSSIACDILEVVERLGAGPIDVFGHSMGGGTALFAEVLQPGTFRSGYFFEPIVFTAGEVPPADNPMASAARLRRATFPSRAEVMWRYSSRPPLNTLRADALAAYVEHGFRDDPDGGVTLKCSPVSEARTFGCSDPLTTDRLVGVQLPVVIAAGYDEPGANPARLAPLVAEALPHGRLARYEHIGHFGPLQDPQTIAEAIIAHADEVTP